MSIMTLMTICMFGTEEYNEIIIRRITATSMFFGTFSVMNMRCFSLKCSFLARIETEMNLTRRHIRKRIVPLAINSGATKIMT